MRWQLVVRCPDCRWRTSDVFEQPEVERYDDVLAADTDRLIEVLDRVTRENMTEQLERFRRALEHDAIEPMDFDAAPSSVFRLPAAGRPRTRGQ